MSRSPYSGVCGSGKDNRDNYVANVRELLVEQGMSDDDAERMVFDLPRAGENIKNWIDATFDKGSVRPRDIPCPFGAKDEAVLRDIAHAWRGVMEVADDLWAFWTRRSVWEALSTA